MVSIYLVSTSVSGIPCVTIVTFSWYEASLGSLEFKLRLILVTLNALEIAAGDILETVLKIDIEGGKWEWILNTTYVFIS